MFLVVDLRKEALYPKVSILSIPKLGKGCGWLLNTGVKGSFFFKIKGYLSQTDTYAGEQGLKCSVGSRFMKGLLCARHHAESFNISLQS